MVSIHRFIEYLFYEGNHSEQIDELTADLGFVEGGGEVLGIVHFKAFYEINDFLWSRHGKSRLKCPLSPDKYIDFYQTRFLILRIWIDDPYP